jgi:hypothetical protein
VDIAGFVDEPPGYGQRPRFWLAIIGIRPKLFRPSVASGDSPDDPSTWSG